MSCFYFDVKSSLPPHHKLEVFVFVVVDVHHVIGDLHLVLPLPALVPLRLGLLRLAVLQREGQLDDGSRLMVTEHEGRAVRQQQAGWVQPQVLLAHGAHHGTTVRVEAA